jgi:myotubularin-related protein 6/7/8
MVGITQNRSVQDEKLIEAIFQSHWSPESRTSNTTVYGATTTNLIIDARPTVNAVANTAKGAGTENMDYYKESKKIYLGIDHIHAMRESIGKVVEALREADQLLASINNDLPESVPGLAVLDRQALRRSGWLRHISVILEGTVTITKNIHVNSSHVLIHCSDGWDRTSQLSALSQLCLDPFYRTIRGFEILIEKDWLSFGHKFLDRCGHLSSEKFFLSPTGDSTSGSGADAAQAFLTSVQNRFASQNHLKETSPVFHQFLETVRQIQRQFPERFEFNERFLHQIYYHLYSCQFGTFLFNCERERKVGDGGPPPCDKTFSIWDFLNSPAETVQNRNPIYDPTLDDPSRRTTDSDMGVLLPNPKDVRFWHELYGRTDEEMNGRLFVPQGQNYEFTSPVDSAEDDPVLQRATIPDLFQGSLSKISPMTQSLKVGLVPSRNTSPGPNIREISSSLPDLAPRPLTRDINTAPSTPVPAPRTQNSSFTSTPANSPIWTRARPPADLLSGGGVRSVWGKLSSNASAAFSAVQDAYSGVAKDLRNTGQEDDTAERTSELRGRETLSAWGQDTSSESRVVPVVMSNPWATSNTSSQRDTAFDDNPWGYVEEPSIETRHEANQSMGPLPLDPTISTPIRKTTGSTGRTSRLGRGSPSTLKPPSPTTKSNTDPLGVGLL